MYILEVLTKFIYNNNTIYFFINENMLYILIEILYISLFIIKKLSLIELNKKSIN